MHLVNALPLVLQATGPGRLGGDLLVLALVAVAASVGWRHGIFIATLAGFQALASGVAALALAGPVADLIAPADVVPAAWRLVIAYVVTFTVVFVGIRLAIGAAVPELALAFAPKPDAVGGAVIGALAGWLLAGAAVVGWSMAGLPEPWRAAPARLTADPGRGLLGLFARCVEPDPRRRAQLLIGEVIPGARAAAARPDGPRPDGPRASEPFLDLDRNDRFDAGEPYLDLDGDGGFTPGLAYDDANGNGRRDLGLLECHWLGSWSGVTVMHAPRITSPARVRLETPPATGDVVYRAAAVDPDGPGQPRFAVRSGGTDEATATMVEIDPQTGIVVLVRPPSDGLTRSTTFTVQVTDPTGLADELPVRVTW